MSQTVSTSFGTINGQTITATDFFSALKREARFAEVLGAVLRRLVLDQMAHEQKVVISDEMLQQYADQVRTSFGLHQSADTRQWMEAQYFDQDDFEAYIRARAIEEELKRNIDSAIVLERFEKIKSQFDRARLAHFVVDSEGLADELVMRVREDGADFCKVALENSLDQETRDNGGYLGIVSRNEMANEVAEAVFAAENGDLVGPFHINGDYHGVHVIELMSAQPTESLLAQVKSDLLEQAIQNVVTQSDITLELPT